MDSSSSVRRPHVHFNHGDDFSDGDAVGVLLSDMEIRCAFAELLPTFAKVLREASLKVFQVSV